MPRIARTRCLRFTLAVVLSAACAAGARASIISTSASVNLIAPPASVEKDALTAADTAFAFAERSGLTLGSTLTVDIAGAGTFASFPATATIGAGTVIDTWFLHYDVQGNGFGDLSGTLVFDSDILGVIGRNTRLFDTNATLGAPGTSYPASGAQGIFDSANDTVTISSDLRTLDFRFTVGTAIDAIRIITAPSPVPAPATLALLGLALAGFGVTKRRRR